MENHWDIPVIDIRKVGLFNRSEEVETKYFTKIGKSLVEGFSNYGAVYIVNHGMDEHKHLAARRMAKKFFELPLDVKVPGAGCSKRSMFANMDVPIWLKHRCLSFEQPAPAHRHQNNVKSGWLGHGMEYSVAVGTRVDNKAPDMKEAINVSVDELDTFPWPDEAVLPTFRPSLREFLEQCRELGQRLVKALDAVLSPETHTILKAHEKLGGPGSRARGKLLYYPPVPEGSGDGLRLNEHTDWGTFTLLLQDDCGGLQMRDREGAFHHAAPKEGAILVQAADLLQRWTSNVIWATPHRLAVLPENRHKPRESTAYFVTPDDGFPVSPLDGSDLYETTESGRYIDAKMKIFQEDDETIEKRLTPKLAKRSMKL